MMSNEKKTTEATMESYYKSMLVKMKLALEKANTKVAFLALVGIFLTIRMLTQSIPKRTHTAHQLRAMGQPALFSTLGVKCDKVPLNNMTSFLRSQSEEDQDLLKWFNGLCHGTYIEMGGLDGMDLSNSYAFNKGPLGWKGVLIEPSNRYNDLIQNRPNEIATIRGAVRDTDTTVHWVENGHAVGGIWEFAAESFKEQWWKGVEVGNLPKVKCSPLQTLLDKHAPRVKYYDFFSLDVEGAELMVLESIDYDKIGFGIIFVEADEHSPAKNLMVRSLLTSKGYQFLMEKGRSYWFANAHFDDIYRGILN